MIYGDIFHQKLQLVNAHTVADTIDYLEMKFCFRTDDWMGFEKWAHFSNGDTVYDILLTDDCIRKEDHLNLSAGEWSIYLHGNEYCEGNVSERITTEPAFLTVGRTGTYNGDPFPEVPASVTERILARLTFLESFLIDEIGETTPWEVRTLDEFKLLIAAGYNPVTLAPDADITVSETLNLPAGTVIHGNGATVRRAAGFEEILFRLNAGCRLENFVIEGNRSAMVNPTWDKTIEITTATNCVIDSITINDANEAIVVYRDDVIVRGCRLNNCGGNGIHMSDANRTRIEDCVIIGANKSASQMGNSNGCIYWCAEANETVVTGCHCEDGLAGFGGIDGIDNMHLKIIGCTVKDCDRSIAGQYKSTGGPIDVVISGNQFIGCGNLLLSDASNKVAPGDGVIISENVFTDTGIRLEGFRNAVVRGNIFSNNALKGYAVRLIRCPNVLVEGNSINSPNEIAIVMDLCPAANILGNTIRYKTNAVNTTNSAGVAISNNILRQVVNGGTGNALHFNSSPEAAVDNNKIFAYSGGGIVAVSNSRTMGNFIVVADSSQIAIRVWGGHKNYVVAQNMSNGTFAVATGTDAVVQNNIAIESTAFVDVVYTLTNLTTDGFAKALTGDDFGFTLTAADGYVLPDTITVTMGGTALAAGAEYTYDKATGKVTLYRVSGAVEVTAGGV